MSTSALTKCDGCKSVKNNYEYSSTNVRKLCLDCRFEEDKECISCGIIKKRKLLILAIRGGGLYCYKCFSL